MPDEEKLMPCLLSLSRRLNFTDTLVTQRAAPLVERSVNLGYTPAVSKQVGTSANVCAGSLCARELVLQEILKSEQSYIDGLLLVKDFFLDPLVKSSTTSKPILRASAIAEIFSNFTDILTCNSHFLSMMEDRLGSFLSGNSHAADQIKVGDVFASVFPYLKSERPYVH